MAAIVYVRPDYISRIDSTGYATLGYQLNGTFGSVYKRCTEKVSIMSSVSQGMIALPNNYKYDPYQTYDAPVSLAPFSIDWTIYAQPGTSTSSFLGSLSSDIDDLGDYPKYRVRVYASDVAGNLWYVNTRCRGLQVTYQEPLRLARATIRLEPYSSEWLEGGPSTAT